MSVFRVERELGRSQRGYGQWVTKTIKTFLATYPPADGVIRVVIVKEEDGCQFFFCTDPQATPRKSSKPSPIAPRDQ